jgi:two-component system sensor histidine kinase TctE
MTKGLSLKRQLLLWLLIPQLLLWLIGAVLSNSIAIHYADTIIDNDLAQLANTLFQQAHHESISSTQELATKPFLSHQDDRVYFTVSRPGQPAIISNINHIPACTSQTLSLNQPVYCSNVIAQQPVRILTILLSRPEQPHLSIQVHVAKNLILRNQLTREILLATVIPLSVLIIIMSFLIWWRINRELKPLYQLQQSFQNRPAYDLKPVEIINAPVEINALTQALNSLLQAISHSIDKQRHFIADAAHQLRTPLAGLKSQTELAMRETNIDNLQSRLQMVHHSSVRSIHLINQLLTLARSEPGQQDIMLRIDADLAKLIREIATESVPRALAANIDLGCDSSLTTAIIKANSALLRELFLNLVENAIKYTPSGSTVTLRLFAQGIYYVVEVEDNGPGMTDIDKARAFERFYRGTQTGNGCGLGLAIVKEIVLRHHGHIELRDVKPHGLMVRISLPKPE